MRYEKTSAIAARHRLLLDLIREGRNSARKLAELLGVSEPTVNRDIEFLRQQGFPIKAVRFDRCWAYQVLERIPADDSPDAGGVEE